MKTRDPTTTGLTSDYGRRMRVNASLSQTPSHDDDSSSSSVKKVDTDAPTSKSGYEGYQPRSLSSKPSTTRQLRGGWVRVSSAKIGPAIAARHDHPRWLHRDVATSSLLPLRSPAPKVPRELAHRSPPRTCFRYFTLALIPRIKAAAPDEPSGHGTNSKVYRWPGTQLESRLGGEEGIMNDPSPNSTAYRLTATETQTTTAMQPTPAPHF